MPMPTITPTDRIINTTKHLTAAIAGVQEAPPSEPSSQHSRKQAPRTRLNARGYYQCQHTPGLWRHVWRDIMFCLVVDDFGVKTTAREHIEHLKTTLEEHYTVAMDWDGSLFLRHKH